MSDKFLQDQILRIYKDMSTNRAQKLGRNNLLMQKGSFYSPQEWEQKKKETEENARLITERLYPEKYKK